MAMYSATLTSRGTRVGQAEELGRRAAVDRDILAEALDALAGHVVVLDGNGTIVYTNAAWRRFGEANGLPPDVGGLGANYLGACDEQGADGENARRAREGIVDILTGVKSSFSLEYPCHSPTKPRWFILRGRRFVVGEWSYVVLAHDDITARRLAEDAVRSRHAELEAFNASVSHDLRAPLRRIQTLVSDIVEKRNLSAAEAERVLDRIRADAGRARELITALLALSRATSADLARRDVDVSTMATDVWNELGTGDAKGATIEIQPGMRAIADPELLRIVLVALIENAKKFSMRAASPHIQIGAKAVDGVTAYYVSDNGVGFPQSETHALFEPFHRLSSAVDFEGTGIGLATVRRIVERHHGRVWAESTPGQGATFWFTIGR